jgi:hypothetical protein
MKRNNRLKQFFLRVRTKIGYKPAIIAIARKLLMLIHHLLMNMEQYFEENMPQKKFLKPKILSLQSLNPDQIIQTISDAVSFLEKSDCALFFRKLNQIRST